MKFWLKVSAQCEAQDVLGKNCDRRADFIVLCRVGSVRGGSGAIGGLPPLLMSNLSPASPEASHWYVSKKQPGGAPCAFCQAHGRAGIAKIDGE